MAMSPNEHIKDEISDVEAMLPWYAAGTLSAQESALVEAGLADDAALRQQLVLAREELEQDVKLNEGLGAPSGEALVKLMAGIAAEPSRVPLSASLKMKFSNWMENFIGSMSPVGLGMSVAAAAIIICVQAVILAGLYLQKDPVGSTYQTASHGASGQVQTGTLALIAFQPQARAGQISAFLDKHALQIVGGPKPGGFYIIRIDAKILDEAVLTRRLDTLRANAKIVRFAAPAK